MPQIRSCWVSLFLSQVQVWAIVSLPETTPLAYDCYFLTSEPVLQMDRASILGDAINYLKGLLQKINDLHNELKSMPPGIPTPSTSFHPLTPISPSIPSGVKEELGPSSLPSPKGQSARVEVRVSEGQAVNIHMSCARRPGLLLSAVRALDNLGLDVQQAVISCFNGFALDVLRAEQRREGQEVLPEQIKAVLLDSAGFQNVI